MRALILGVNGFIGSALAHRMLRTTDHEIYGLDVENRNLEDIIEHDRFFFRMGDIRNERKWVEEHVDLCDVVLPLVAIATPRDYVQRPLAVFELTFEENLRIIRDCVREGTRLLFPSSSEVYGMCPEESFDEETSVLVTGPISKQRWIYSASKQLLDRVIWAYGSTGQLRFTIFRPFNWIGPKLDGPSSARIGSCRVVTQIADDILHGAAVRLVGGGRQTRCFTYIDDGIDCLMRIIEDKSGACDGRIVNIGSPGNECSIERLAQLLLQYYGEMTGNKARSRLVSIPASEMYGPGYQDVERRRPSIRTAGELLGWQPRFDLETTLRKTLSAFLEEAGVGVRSGAPGAPAEQRAAQPIRERGSADA